MLLAEDRLSYTTIDSKTSRAWNALGPRVAESLPLVDTEKFVSRADSNTNTGFVSRLSASGRQSDHELAKREVEKQDGLKARTGGWAEDRGSIPTRNVNVTPATQSGAKKSDNGYLFTIEDTSNGTMRCMRQSQIQANANY